MFAAAMLCAPGSQNQPGAQALLGNGAALAAAMQVTNNNNNNNNNNSNNNSIYIAAPSSLVRSGMTERLAFVFEASPDIRSAVVDAMRLLDCASPSSGFAPAEPAEAAAAAEIFASFNSAADLIERRKARVQAIVFNKTNNNNNNNNGSNISSRSNTTRAGAPRLQVILDALTAYAPGVDGIGGNNMGSAGKKRWRPADTLGINTDAVSGLMYAFGDEDEMGGVGSAMAAVECCLLHAASALSKAAKGATVALHTATRMREITAAAAAMATSAGVGTATDDAGGAGAAGAAALVKEGELEGGEERGGAYGCVWDGSSVSFSASVLPPPFPLSPARYTNSLSLLCRYVPLPSLLFSSLLFSSLLCVCLYDVYNCVSLTHTFCFRMRVCVCVCACVCVRVCVGTAPHCTLSVRVLTHFQDPFGVSVAVSSLMTFGEHALVRGYPCARVIRFDITKYGTKK